ncbi:hypothetical protein G6W41_03395 [Campylobacter concisus]|jgi:hypothetical protein|uniref:hypothetical protein n=1 Tax=Campylobacter concisus TaxID=199 RepID=UPI0018835CBA|nr:hypothetical protein [Campylobacter concisus]MBE9863175.1 hypothetical protein [Campylobacter concisus]
MTAKRYVRLYELEKAKSFDELISTLEQSQDVSRNEAIYQAGAKAWLFVDYYINELRHAEAQVKHLKRQLDRLSPSDKSKEDFNKNNPLEAKGIFKWHKPLKGASLQNDMQAS